jgi:phosphate/sulfate permease
LFQNKYTLRLYIRLRNERIFLFVIAFLFIIVGITYPYAFIARWIGFALAGYSAISNDSIQTIGTFIASNEDKKWWWLWLFIGAIFVGVVAYSWHTFGGDVSYQRLQSKGFDQTPQSFTYLQIAAPIFLLILTRLRMPVSTSFLLLSCFAANASAIEGMLAKTLWGYVIAFVSSIVIWLVLSKVIEKIIQGEPHPLWRVFQWAVSGMLWAAWLMQDAANIAVYLPRSLSLWQFVIFAGYILFGLIILFYNRGDRVQEIVTEKSDVRDTRSATLINLVYTGILFYFKVENHIPMSTTWVFLGLLAGREIAMSFTSSRSNGKSLKRSFRLMGHDIVYALIGLIVSIVLAIAINPDIKYAVTNFFTG